MLDTIINVTDGKNTVQIDTYALNHPDDFHAFVKNIPEDFAGTMPNRQFNPEVTEKYGTLSKRELSLLHFIIALTPVVRELAEKIAPIANYNADYIISALSPKGAKAGLPAIDPFDYEIYNKLQMLCQYLVMYSTLLTDSSTGFDVHIEGYCGKDIYVVKDLRDSFRLAREPIYLTE